MTVFDTHTFAGRRRAADLPFKETLGPVVKRARARRLQAQATGDAGRAAAAEQDWGAQRAAWVGLLELCHWTPADADIEIASLERRCDAAAGMVLERKPGLSLDGLLGALGQH